MSIVGLLHPGEMGAAIGRSLLGAGHTVLWASNGRSAATASRAAAFTDVGTVAAVASRAEVIICVCPPHAALDVARQVAGCRGRYVDANAVSPAAAAEIGAVIGASFTDGGIVGPPPDGPGQTRFYLSGDQALTVAALFDGTFVEARIVPNASAMKMAYAAWTKGTAALLLAITALARAEGIEDALLAEWQLSQPGLPARADQSARNADAKGWRWIAEMEEIARTMRDRDLPPGFHLAAAEIYRRWPHLFSLDS